MPADPLSERLDELAGDPPCTDCGDTGITFQTERPCTCAAGLRAQGKAS